MKILLLILLSMLHNFAVAEVTVEDEFSEFESETGSSESLTHFSGSMQIEEGRVISNKRLRFKLDRPFEKGGLYLKGDFVQDDIKKLSSVDVRELRFQYKLSHWLDLSLGRQVSTWGVGDMLFINDLFPKNWIANFQGRDMEMLKDPSNSLRLTSYTEKWTADLVYTPNFSADTFPQGCVFETFDLNSSKVKHNNSNCGEYKPLDDEGEELKRGELALSVKRKIDNQEVALYYYDGFYKSPKGVFFNPSAQFYHPALSVYGASSEGQWGPGIFSFEIGYYQSKDDLKGDDYFVENSKFKYLIGYKADLSSQFSYGVQWYQEKLENYDKYEDSVKTNNPLAFDYRRKEYQNTFTLRLTYKAMQDTLYFSLFSYIRPEDKDKFTKLEVSKKMTDDIKLAAGVNVFDGEDNYSDREFGMLKDEDNAFLRLDVNF